MRRFTILLLASLLVGGCAVGAPLSFSSGSIWSFPLVAPLESGMYLVPVKVHGKGPYLFLVDPDAPISSVDSAIQGDLDLYTQRIPEMLDERDKKKPLVMAEVRKLQIGDKLTISNIKVLVHKFGTYWAAGRLVRGVLGRDVIADSLIFAANRDTGVGTLAVQGKLSAPAGAQTIKYRIHRRDSQSPRRRLVKGMVNGTHKVTMHLDLGGHSSSLWTKKLAAFGLPTLNVNAVCVDELATIHKVAKGGLAASVSVGDVKVDGVLMLPYLDKRTRDVDLDGSLGQNFFRDYNVTVNWHKKTFWLVKRAQDVSALSGERMRRWGPAIDKCANPGCVSAVLTPIYPPGATPPAAPASPASPATEAGAEAEAEAGAGPESEPGTDPDAAGKPAPEAYPQPMPPQPPPPPPPPPPEPTAYALRVARDAAAPGTEFEVVLEALDANGTPLNLPRLSVTMAKGQAAIEDLNFDPSYGAAASFRVLDWGPFPRECRAGRCIFPLAQKL